MSPRPATDLPSPIDHAPSSAAPLQSTLMFSPPDPVARALAVLRREPLAFKHVTEGWLRRNRHVWRSFFEATERLRRRGVRRYGAKAVMEYLRYESAVRDSDVVVKLNNNQTSGLARLYNAVVGTEFFETRT